LHSSKKVGGTLQGHTHDGTADGTTELISEHELTLSHSALLTHSAH
jgi:hypothetical protein